MSAGVRADILGRKKHVEAAVDLFVEQTILASGLSRRQLNVTHLSLADSSLISARISLAVRAGEKIQRQDGHL